MNRAGGNRLCGEWVGGRPESGHRELGRASDGQCDRRAACACRSCRVQMRFPCTRIGDAQRKRGMSDGPPRVRARDLPSDPADSKRGRRRVPLPAPRPSGPSSWHPCEAELSFAAPHAGLFPSSFTHSHARAKSTARPMEKSIPTVMSRTK